MCRRDALPFSLTPVQVMLASGLQLQLSMAKDWNQAASIKGSGFTDMVPGSDPGTGSHWKHTCPQSSCSHPPNCLNHQQRISLTRVADHGSLEFDSVY